MNDPEAVVRSLINAVSTGDIDGMLSHLAPDIEITEPESLPYGGVHRGIEAFCKDVIGVMLANAEMGATNHKFLAAGDNVAVSMLSSATSRRTGNVLHMPFMELYTVKDGLVTRIEVYPQDTKKLVEFLEAN